MRAVVEGVFCVWFPPLGIEYHGEREDVIADFGGDVIEEAEAVWGLVLLMSKGSILTPSRMGVAIYWNT